VCVDFVLNNGIVLQAVKQNAINPNSVVLSDSQAANAVQSLQLMSSINHSVWTSVQQLQKIMRKFFAFDIEEGVMKSEIEKVFSSVQKVKTEQQVSSSKVEELMALLAASVSGGNSSNRAIDDISGGNNAVSSIKKQQMQQYQQSQPKQPTQQANSTNSKQLQLGNSQSDSNIPNAGTYQSSRDIRKAAAAEANSFASLTERIDHGSSSMKPASGGGQALLPIGNKGIASNAAHRKGYVAGRIFLCCHCEVPCTDLVQEWKR
jgi:hypothetical protein